MNRGGIRYGEESSMWLRKRVLHLHEIGMVSKTYRPASQPNNKEKQHGKIKKKYKKKQSLYRKEIVIILDFIFVNRENKTNNSNYIIKIYNF